MVKNATEVLNPATATPRWTARHRLLDLTRNKGAYRWVYPTQFGQDTVSIRQQHSAPPAVTNPSPSWFNRFGKASSPVGLASALSILGGMIGGGPLGALLTGAGLAGLVSVMHQTVYGMLLSQANLLKQVWSGLKTGAAGERQNEVAAAPAHPPVKTPLSQAAENHSERHSVIEKSGMVVALEGGSLQLVSSSPSLVTPDPKPAVVAAAPAVNPFIRPTVQSSDNPAGFRTGSDRLNRLGESSSSPLQAVPAHNLNAPVGIVELDERGAQVTILKPGMTKPLRLKELYSVSEPLMTGLEQVAANLKQALAEHGVTPENSRVVARPQWLESLDNEAALDALGQRTGFAIEVLSPEEEAGYVYAGVLRDQDAMNPFQENMVLAVNDQDMKIAFGKGPRTVDETLAAQGSLPLGVKKLGLQESLSPVDVSLAREQAKTLLQEWVDEDMKVAASGRSAFLGHSPLYDVIRGIELKRSAGGRDIFVDGLDVDTIDWFLSPQGLKHLQQTGLAWDSHQ